MNIFNLVTIIQITHKYFLPAQLSIKTLNFVKGFLVVLKYLVVTQW